MADTNNFQEITYKRATELIRDSVNPNAEINMTYYNGDHWNTGEGWIGPLLDSTHPLFNTTFQAIQKMFTFQNVVREVTEREVHAASGEMPSWKVVLKRVVDEETPMTPEEKMLVSEAEKHFERWLSAHNVLQEFREALINAATTGEGVVRFFIPNSMLQEGQRLEPELAIDVIHIEAIAPTSATVYRDQFTLQEIGLVEYTVEDIISGEDVDLVEKVWTDNETGNTIIQVIPRSENELIQEGTSEIELNGEKTIKSVKRDPLITPSILSLQKQLNLALTMQGRNLSQSGFLQMLITNAQLPGHFETDENGEEYFVPDSMQVGAGSTTFLAGHVIQDAEGNEKLAEPKVNIIEPSPNETFITAAEQLHTAILSEASQLHAVTLAMSRLSGESRAQNKAEFLAAAQTSANAMLELVTWASKVFFSFSDLFAGTRYYENLELSSEVVLNSGVSLADDVQALVAMYNSGIISASTVRNQYGLNNVSDEESKIASQPFQSAELSKLRSETFLLLVRSGVDPFTAAIASGYSIELANEIATNYQNPDGSNEGQAASASAGDSSSNTSVRISALNNDPETATPNPLKDTSNYR